MIDEMERYSIRINFPRDSIHLDDVPGWKVNIIDADLQGKETFTVEDGKKRYTINPVMVTYATVSLALPF